MSVHDEWDKQRATDPIERALLVNVERATNAVNAFPLLLAVTKAAEWTEDQEYGSHAPFRCALCEACRPEGHESTCLYAQLDATHPDWREWA